MAGISNIFIGTKRFIQHNRCRIQAVNLGRHLLEPLEKYVRQDQWDAAQNDYVAGHPLRKGTRTGNDEWVYGIPAVSYTPQYEISVPPGLPSTNAIRKVKLTISWTDPSS